MQQHTGQHVLSAAFERLFQVRTVSFHMGAESSTIDLARETTATEIAAAEDLANAVVWEDRQVTIRYATAEEASRMPLRKEPARGGTLRLIDVSDFDLSACGGTHVARTGAIGVIAVAAWERFKGGQRIEFLCGGRALRRWRALRDNMIASVRLLSVLPSEVAGAIERMQNDAKEQKRALTALQTELARFRSDELAARGAPLSPDAPGITLVAHAIDADANGLKALATAISDKPGFIAVLVSTTSPALVVVARNPTVRVAANTVVAKLIAQFGGRGGGRPELAQAGGLTGDPGQILKAATKAARE
jgi:alanyl-tRNA synthetase